MRLRLSRSVTFRAHHRLLDPDRSLEENRSRFGWTVEPHPHQYRVEVTVAGPPGFPGPVLVDLATLDRILAEEVIGRYDGRQLHRDLPEFERAVPTCEAIAAALFARIAGRIPEGIRLARVMVAEDESLSAECLGDE